MEIIDSHIHCGVQNAALPFSQIAPLLENAGIQMACLFAPVEDIYFRYAADFDDNELWRETRESAHAYLLDLAKRHNGIFPYYFVWNDFVVDDLDRGFSGIKWHHHEGEPEYHYASPECEEMIDAICERKMPVVLEETFDTTLDFLDRIDGRTAVIIPHLGLLNGSYERLYHAGIWENDTVYADTALAGELEIRHFIENYGSERLLFGSDYPFGRPGNQLNNILHLGLSDADLENICHNNFMRLIEG